MNLRKIGVKFAMNVRHSINLIANKFKYVIQMLYFILILLLYEFRKYLKK